MTDPTPFDDYALRLREIASAARKIRAPVNKLMAEYPYTRTPCLAMLVVLNEVAKLATRELPAEICDPCPGDGCTRCSGYGFLRRADLDAEVATDKQEALLARHGHPGVSRKRAGHLIDAVVTASPWGQAGKEKERKERVAKMLQHIHDTEKAQADVPEDIFGR